MFRLFKKLSVKEEDRARELRFQLSEDVEIIIGLNEPPYYSRASLLVSGKGVIDVSISAEKVENLQDYTHDEMKTNELFLLKLKELGLTEFVNKVETYIDATPQAECGFVLQ